MNISTNEFVQNLKRTLNETKGYYDGEVDKWETWRERMKVLLATEPSTAEDIVAFVIFLESINVLQNEKMLDKVKRAIDIATLSIPKENLSVAINILSKYEKPKGFLNRLFNDHTKKFEKDYNPFSYLPAETPFQL